MVSVRRSAPVVGDRWIVALLLVLPLAIAVAYLSLGIGPQGGIRPGDPAGHLLGIGGAALMAIGLLYPLVKRATFLSFLKPWWHQIHLLLGAAGAIMAAMHLCGRLDKAPALVALAVLGLLTFGFYGRLLAGRFAYTTFAADPAAFLPASPAKTERFRALAKRKAVALAAVDPGAQEATFSLALRHWARHPVASTRYLMLALEEERMVGQERRFSGGPLLLLQRNWRLLHLILVALMGLGLLAHVAMTLFFAGYLAGGGDVYWWHFRR